MPIDLTYALVVFFAFLIAGTLKGAVGMGLPPTAVALASLFLPLQEALALMTVPTLLTNIWQAFWGGHLHSLVRRFWPMALAIFVGCAVSALGIRALGSPIANGILGLLLVAFAVIALLAWQPRLPRRFEIWCNPLIGFLTGVVGGITGIAAIPFLPYMQSLEMERNELVQALGLLFICFTIAVSGALLDAGAFTIHSTAGALYATIPTVAGLWLGQKLRQVISAELFRRIFLLVLLGLGLNMARSLL